MLHRAKIEKATGRKIEVPELANEELVFVMQLFMGLHQQRKEALDKLYVQDIAAMFQIQGVADYEKAPYFAFIVALDATWEKYAKEQAAKTAARSQRKSK